MSHVTHAGAGCGDTRCKARRLLRIRVDCQPELPLSDLAITDLHSHLVPGVDDGAATVAESITALEGLRTEGVVQLVTTPHLLVPRLPSDDAIARVLDEHRRGFARLAEALRDRNDLPAVALGQEIWLPDVAAARRLLRQPGIGLGDTRYLLVEFGFDPVGTQDDVIAAVLNAGWRIVVAHPERYRFPPSVDALDTIRRWHELGAALQINAGSLSGYYNNSSPDSESLAWQMIEAGLAHLVATDHHAANRAGVSPREALSALTARGAHTEGRRLLGENPGRIARNIAPLPVPPLTRGLTRARVAPPAS